VRGNSGAVRLVITGGIDVTIRDDMDKRAAVVRAASRRARPAATVLAALVVLVAPANGCSKQRSVSRPLSESAHSAHYIFNFAAGDGVNAEWQERFFDWASATIGVTIEERIHYYKYFSRDHMREVIGVGNSNAYANVRTFALHTLWRADNHETIHLLASRFASPGPVPLFAEGFAVAHQVDPVKADFAPKWNGRYLPDHVIAFRADGRFVPPHRLLTAKAFRAVDDVVSYPIAGAFVRYLLDRFGYDKVKDLLRRGHPNDTEATVRETFVSVFGADIERVEADWRSSR
jgi:hypothetical protein